MMAKQKNKQNFRYEKSRLSTAENIRLIIAAVILSAIFWVLTVGFNYNGAGESLEISKILEIFTANLTMRFSGAQSIIISIIDIVLFTFLVYLALYFLHKHHVSLLLRFILPLIIIAIIATCGIFNLPIMGFIFSNTVVLLTVAILIMFPQELRRGMLKLASHSQTEIFNTEYDCTEEQLRKSVIDIVKAVLSMSKDNKGALIVIAPLTPPEHIIDTGTMLNAEISQHLIECLFNTSANLHDGAVFIHGNKVVAAGCFLPLTQRQNLPQELGTRHRAAMGMSEQYPVLVIIVSEETGIISVSQNGGLERYFDAEMLADAIEKEYGLKAIQKNKRQRTVSKTTRKN